MSRYIVIDIDYGYAIKDRHTFQILDVGLDKEELLAKVRKLNRGTMHHITLDWSTYLADAAYWQRVSQEKGIPLHIGDDPETAQ